ncbi:nitrogen permease regulator 2-like protein isoform X2 [Orbicella faveolata]|uniref:nitrogen permease regulator 2-like protein isoform X2 n=1 Tax=Orbicella faveolata TaxID=48498 RepID=UPI0009E24D44|nr:nitrogen permease regulator 2-like protein isoform X2 [Orbicella faveolata]
MNKSKELECILFCEFHPIAGPKIVYQVPEDFISKEEFDCVAVYIIPKPELQSKLITINALDRKFIGCPISIENAKYSRNALVFNVCFVLGPNVDTIRYEGVVKKLAGYMTSLELEYGFLSQEETKASLPCVLSEIVLELNEKGKCTIQIDEANTIHLKCNIAISSSPCSVLDHQVPVFICNKDALSSSAWDITTQQILRYIDGFNHVQRIAAEADVEISLVRRCMQDMIQCKIVKLIPIFQYSNVYIPTPEVNQLTHDKKLQEECLNFVGKKGRTSPSFRDVFMLYCGLSPGATVRDLCTRYNPGSLRVDERRLIQFGMVTGIIRRLHKYPVQLTTPKSEPVPRGHHKLRGRHRDSDTNRVKLDDKWLDGNHNYDEICCKTGRHRM